MNTDHATIYSRISAKDLIADLLHMVRKQRPKVSRNTVRLAFVNGPTTPARKMIVEIGERLLAANELPDDDITTLSREMVEG